MKLKCYLRCRRFSTFVRETLAGVDSRSRPFRRRRVSSGSAVAGLRRRGLSRFLPKWTAALTEKKKIVERKEKTRFFDGSSDSHRRRRHLLAKNPFTSVEAIARFFKLDGLKSYFIRSFIV